MIDASDFAGDTTPRGYGFGLNVARVAAALRRLADDIVAGRTNVERAEVVGYAVCDDFTRKALTLTLTERIEP